VEVNGKTETRRGKKLRDGDVVQVSGTEQGPMEVSFTDDVDEVDAR
jgi:ribosome-associated protein YbcJ (S4-like RNA binding protein)